MSKNRVSLIHFDLLRELCDHCRKERFHFVPIGEAPVTGTCKNCGSDSKLADVSDTAIWRLMTKPNGDVVVVPLVAN